MTPNDTKPANSAGKSDLKRRNIALTPSTEERGEKLATLEKRSFSNLVEVLIDKEYTRLGLDKQEASA